MPLLQTCSATFSDERMLCVAKPTGVGVEDKGSCLKKCVDEENHSMLWLLFLLEILGQVDSQSAPKLVPFYAGNVYNVCFFYKTAASSVNAADINTFITGANLSFTITALNETFEANTVTLEMNFSSIVCISDPHDIADSCKEYRILLLNLLLG
jgi:hypothetical protein